MSAGVGLGNDGYLTRIGQCSRENHTLFFMHKAHQDPCHGDYMADWYRRGASI